MGDRLDLQDLFETLLGTDHVYFQTPPTFGMSYPCIVYSLNNIHVKFADNMSYNHQKRYTVTVIDPDPDSAIPDKVAALPQCRFDRYFTSENLNHYVFNLLF